MIGKIRLATIVLSAFSVFMAAAPAMALEFTPDGSGTLSGTLTLQQSQTLNCAVSVDVDITNGEATLSNESIDPGDSLCSLVNPFGNWTVEPVSTSSVRINVGASSLLGSCEGEVVADFDSGDITFNNAQIPGQIFGFPAPCTINGTLFSDTDVEIE